MQKVQLIRHRQPLTRFKRHRQAFLISNTQTCTRVTMTILQDCSKSMTTIAARKNTRQNNNPQCCLLPNQLKPARQRSIPGSRVWLVSLKRMLSYWQQTRLQQQMFKLKHKQALKTTILAAAQTRAQHRRPPRRWLQEVRPPKQEWLLGRINNKCSPKLTSWTKAPVLTSLTEQVLPCTTMVHLKMALSLIQVTRVGLPWLLKWEMEKW